MKEQELLNMDRKNDKDEEWVELVLPMEFETKRKCLTIPLGTNKKNWSDPRTKEGELLTPSRMGEKQVNDLKNTLGSYSNILSYLLPNFYSNNKLK